MTAPGEWIYIDGDAWELHGLGTQYTVHQENDRWVARSYSMSHKGDTAKAAEETAETVDEAKQIVDRWESQR